MFLQVPSLYEEKDPHKSMKKFTECYPVFDVLGKEKLIDSDIPYVCDDQVYLVCKYLKAMKANTLDQVLEGNCFAKWCWCHECHDRHEHCMKIIFASQIIFQVRFFRQSN